MDNSKLFSNAGPDSYFILRNGRALKNLYELTNSLASMDDETFSYHVNKEKNDFANWIRHVFQDEKLANQILGLRTRRSILKKINKRLSNAGKKKGKAVKPWKSDKARNAKSPIFKSETYAEDKKEKTKDSENHGEIIKKLDEILLKEKELNKREQKVQEIEQRIEKKLAKAKKNNNTNGAGTEAKFFSKEFVQ